MSKEDEEKAKQRIKIPNDEPKPHRGNDDEIATEGIIIQEKEAREELACPHSQECIHWGDIITCLTCKNHKYIRKDENHSNPSP